MSPKSEYTMSAQELIQETIRLRALEKQFTKERGGLMARVKELELSLAAIGELAVADWDDDTVGKVDAVLKEPTRYRDLLRSLFTADKRAEAAEARVRELEDGIRAVLQGRVTLAPPAIIHDLRCAYTDRTAERNEHRVQREKAEARLAAVLGAADAMREVVADACDFLAARDAVKHYDAARTGGEAHPDSVKPKCFGDNQCPKVGDYQNCPFAVECDNAVCAETTKRIKTDAIRAQ